MLLTRILQLFLIAGLVGLPNLAASQTQEKTQQTTPHIVEVQSATKQAVKPKLKFKKHGGVVYRKADEYELKCDLYVPEGDGPFPAIIAIHGGAWRSGTKFAMLRHAWRMAKSGYVVVAINYRHAPKDPFPAQVHDCKHAVRWIRASAGKYKIDPAKVGAFGYSAGGHLVAMLGTTDVNDQLEGRSSQE